MADEPMTGMQKLAVLLRSLPAETVDKVLRHMDPRQSKTIAGEVTKVADDPELAEKLAKVLDEAVSMLAEPAAKPAADAKAKTVSAPAADKPTSAAVETVIDLNIDDELAAKAAAPPTWASAQGGDPRRALAQIPVELLAAALESENARTIFIVMESLKMDVAGRVYKLLSPAQRREVSLRFTEKLNISDHLTRQVAQGVLKKCQALRTSAGATNADEERLQRMAALLKGLERNERLEMLAMFQKTDPTLTERIKNLLYQFEIIARMENAAVQKLLAEVNLQSLAVALKGAPGEVEERITANLSKRAQEALREEISLVGNVAPAKVHEARQSVVLEIQQMDQRGELLLRE